MTDYEFIDGNEFIGIENIVSIARTPLRNRAFSAQFTMYIIMNSLHESFRHHEN